MADKTKAELKKMMEAIRRVSGPMITPRSKCWDNKDVPRKTRKKEIQKEINRSLGDG